MVSSQPDGAPAETPDPNQDFWDAPFAVFVTRVSGEVVGISRRASTLLGVKVGGSLWPAVRSSKQEVVSAVRKGLLDSTPVQIRVADARTQQVRTLDIDFAVLKDQTLGRLIIGVVRSQSQPPKRRVSRRQPSTRDPLTGLVSRAGCIAELERRLTTQAFAGVAVLYLDLDEFKRINDSYGHDAGDHLLQVTADRIRATIKESDVVARMGGDEFAIITNAGEADALMLAHRVSAALRPPVIVQGLQLHSGASIGIGIRSDPGDDAENIIHDADQAMYEAKQYSTGPRIAMSSRSSRERRNRRGRLEADFADSLDTKQISFVYQPIRRLGNYEVQGAEAFVRWEHPLFGLVETEELLAIARSTRNVRAFTEWSLEAVAADWSQLRSRYPRFINKRVSFNIDPIQITVEDFVAMYTTVINRHGLRKGDIILEVQDTKRRNRTGMNEALKVLADDGMSVALDYFGVGYNALEFVTAVPVVGFKVGQTLVRSLTEPTEAQTAKAIVEGLMLTTGRLGLMASAEGLEVREQIILCEELGLHGGQGFIFGSPSTLDRFEARERAIEEALRQLSCRDAALDAVIQIASQFDLSPNLATQW